jgi:hypothetical protein
MEKHLDHKNVSWENIAKEGDELFDYLIHNYKNMFDKEEKIKHFDIDIGWFMLFEESREVKEKYNDEIQRELVPWIKKEFQNNELFKIENWKPFRNQHIYTHMYLGYRKLFQYKQYIFQLSLLSRCYNNIPTFSNEKKIMGAIFELQLCGWKEINHEKLQPANIITILDDNIVPKSFWDEKE